MSLRKLIAWCLFPLTMWYAIGVGLRNLLFTTGILRQHTHTVTTIGVGNIACGGTGKTPLVEYLLTLFSGQYTTAFLSRGYRRKTKGYIVADSENCDAFHIGDEPAMIAKKHNNIVVAVCGNRNEGIGRLMEAETPPELVILDDAYQHRFVKPSINILLTEYHRPYFRDHVLPFGDLREPRHASKRADVIIVTKSPSSLNSMEKRTYLLDLKAEPYQKVFFSYLTYAHPTLLDGSATLSLDDIECAVIVTGIANPQPMTDYVSRHCHIRHLPFPDHYNFTSKDVANIRDTYEKSGYKKTIILTTEKDAARMTGSTFENLPIYYLPIKVAFHQNKDYNFDEYIRYAVKEGVMLHTSKTKKPVAGQDQ